MCLAIPGQIEQTFQASGMKMAKVNFGGLRKSICLEYTPEAAIGDYVLVHVGFAITVIDEQEAIRTLRMLAGSDMEELASSGGAES